MKELKKKVKKLKKRRDFCKYIWSSGKILEFTIRSIISRQQYGEDNVMIQRTGKTAEEIEASISEVIDPFRLQMSQNGIEFELQNKIKDTQDEYLANWEMVNQALFHPMVNAVKFNK